LEKILKIIFEKKEFDVCVIFKNLNNLKAQRKSEIFKALKALSALKNEFQ
jgi:hypothetical protein